MSNNKYVQPSIVLFFLGFLGVLSAIPLIPQLLALQAETPPMPVEVIQFISAIQSSVLLLLMIWLGAVFSKKVGLSSPVIVAFTHSTSVYKELKPQMVPALIGGTAGGIFLLSFFGALSSDLPADFLRTAEEFTPAWYTKILYGGITEEIIIRWGLMSFLVWGIYRITQEKGTEIQAYNFVLAIILSALIFGIAHLPLAFALSSVVTTQLIAYVILGNAAFGFIAGYLYWKRGLECAIGAHIIAHITIIIGETLT